jgi:hypothetical protein
MTTTILPIRVDGVWRRPVPDGAGHWACPLCGRRMDEADCFGLLQVDCRRCEVRDVLDTERRNAAA